MEFERWNSSVLFVWYMRMHNITICRRRSSRASGVSWKLFAHFIKPAASVQRIRNDSNENSPNTHIHTQTLTNPNWWNLCAWHFHIFKLSVYHNKCWFKFLFPHCTSPPSDDIWNSCCILCSRRSTEFKFMWKWI